MKRLVLFLTLLLIFPALMAGPAWAQGPDIGARLTAIELRLAKLDVIEARLSALEASRGNSGQDVQAQVLSYYQTLLAAKAMKSLAASFDEPRTFWQQFGDGGVPALGLFAIILRAIGGSFSIGF